MRERLRVVLAMVLVTATVTAPAMAAGAGAGTQEPGEEAPIFATDVLARVWIAERLIDMERDPVEAWRMASQLTPEDVAVLAGNPAMLQRGGQGVGSSLFWGVLLIAGLIAIAWAGDGFVFISS